MDMDAVVTPVRPSENISEALQDQSAQFARGVSAWHENETSRCNPSWPIRYAGGTRIRSFLTQRTIYVFKIGWHVIICAPAVTKKVHFPPKESFSSEVQRK